MAEPFNENDPVRKTYFINVGERSIEPANDAGKLAQLENDGFLDASWLKYVISGSSYEPINASITPVPVYRHSITSLLSSEADNIVRDKFVGFIKTDNSSYSNFPTFIASVNEQHPIADRTTPLTAPAGNNRYVLVTTFHSSNTDAQPTGVTWNGIEMTELSSITWDSAFRTMKLWGLKIGTSLVDQPANIVTSGGASTTNQRYMLAGVYSQVNQTTPYSNIVSANSFGATSLTLAALNHDQGYGRFVGMFANLRLTVGGGATGRGGFFDGTYFRTRLQDILGYTNLQLNASDTFSQIGGFGVALNSSEAPTVVPVQYAGIIGGFTGLTRNAKYYVSNTSGEISLTPGTTSLLVGKALSDTELLIIH